MNIYDFMILLFFFCHYSAIATDYMLLVLCTNVPCFSVKALSAWQVPETDKMLRARVAGSGYH